MSITATPHGTPLDKLANGQLYYKLCMAFGQENVEIHREGVKSNWTHTPNLLAVHGAKRGFKDSYKRDTKGEEYQLNCPYCGDTRQRLYINHGWASKDGVTNSWKTFLAHCHNENCLASPDRQDQLYEYVMRRIHMHKRFDPQMIRSSKAPSTFDGRPPGIITPLDQLPISTPGRRYLVDRQFDPDELARDWGVGVVMQARHQLFAGRIYIPMMFKGQLAGWMCRFPADKLGALSLKEANIRKYLFSAGIHTSDMFYNYDQAKNYQFTILVEGATSAWKAGPWALGCCGNRVHDRQGELLRERAIEGSLDLVVLMLDPDQSASEIRQGRPHHQIVAERTLKSYLGRTTLLPVMLPAGTDPGKLSRRFILEETIRTGRSRGIAKSRLQLLQDQLKRLP